jgi:hypothetical protein
MLGIWKLCAPTPFDTAVCRFWRDCKGQAFETQQTEFTIDNIIREPACAAPCYLVPSDEETAHALIDVLVNAAECWPACPMTEVIRPAVSAHRPLGRDLTIVQRLLFLPTHWPFSGQLPRSGSTSHFHPNRPAHHTDGRQRNLAGRGWEKKIREAGDAVNILVRAPESGARLKPRGASPHIKESPA